MEIRTTAFHRRGETEAGKLESLDRTRTQPQTGRLRPLSLQLPSPLSAVEQSLRIPGWERPGGGLPISHTRDCISFLGFLSFPTERHQEPEAPRCHAGRVAAAVGPTRAPTWPGASQEPTAQPHSAQPRTQPSILARVSNTSPGPPPAPTSQNRGGGQGPWGSPQEAQVPALGEGADARQGE